MFLLFRSEIGLAANAFQLLLPPALLRHVRGVHVLWAQSSAIRVTQCVDQLAQAHPIPAEKGIAGVKYGFLIGV